MMFLFLSTDILSVNKVHPVVSVEMGPFKLLEGIKNKGRSTSLQRVLVPWLISKYGMSYKSAKMEVVMQMVEAIIDRDNLLELGVPCHSAKKTYVIGFNTVVKKAKAAAGLFILMHCMCILFL